MSLKLHDPSLQEVYDTANRPNPLVEEALALVKYRELIRQFVSRSIKTRYKRSVLGVLWTLLNPLLTMIVLTIVFSAVFRFEVENYSIYVLTGLIAWNFLSSSTAGAMGEMLWSGSLLGRIYIPKSVFSVSAVGTALVNLLLSLIPVFLISLVLGIRFTPALLVMPFSILIMTVFALGIGLTLSTAAVYFADMVPVYDVFLTIWMYATPIIYPLEILPEQFEWLVWVNPFYYIVTLFREPLYNGTVPDLNVWLIASGFALLSILIGSYIFTSRSNEYAYRI